MRITLAAGNTTLCIAKLWSQRSTSCSFQLNTSLCIRTYYPVVGKSRVPSQPYALSTSIYTSKSHSLSRNVTSLRASPVSFHQNERNLLPCRRSFMLCPLMIWGGFSRAWEHSPLASSPVQTSSSRVKTSSVLHSEEANCFIRSQGRASLIGQLGFINMIGGRQLRVRKDSKKTTEALVEIHTVRSEIGNAKKSTKKKADGASKTVKSQTTTSKTVEKLNKEDFAVDSWQYKLLELHDDNNLNSLTVMEIRNILREMNRPAKGLKPDLLKSVKEWLSDHGCYTTAPKIDQSTGGDLQLIEVILPKAEVAATNSAVADSLGQGTRSGTKRTVPKFTTPEKTKRQKKVAAVEVSDPVGGAKQSAEAEKLTPKQKRLKRAAKTKEINDSEEIQEDIVLKTGTLTNDKEAWTMLVHKKPQPGWVAYNPTTMRPAPLTSDEKSMKFVSWNVNGLRALLKEKGIQHEQGSLIARLATSEDFDVLCLQETKLQDKDVEQIQESLLVSYEESLWSCSTRKLGYSGTAVISRTKPLSVKYGLGVMDHDHEGRLITVEFESFYFVVSYVPNSGANLDRLAYRTQEWDPALSKYLKNMTKTASGFSNYEMLDVLITILHLLLGVDEFRGDEWQLVTAIHTSVMVGGIEPRGLSVLKDYLTQDLEKKKPVILTGDLNCAHEELDIHNPAGNKRSAGFTDEERESFKTNLLDQGFVDTFRKQHPNTVGYTYWGYRTAARPKNQGWRLDYFLVSESLADRVHDSYTIPDVGGSDHCPVGLILRI